MDGIGVLRTSGAFWNVHSFNAWKHSFDNEAPKITVAGRPCRENVIAQRFWH
jgi:hypothetical protein